MRKRRREEEYEDMGEVRESDRYNREYCKQCATSIVELPLSPDDVEQITLEAYERVKGKFIVKKEPVAYTTVINLTFIIITASVTYFLLSAALGVITGEVVYVG